MEKKRLMAEYEKADAEWKAAVDRGLTPAEYDEACRTQDRKCGAVSDALAALNRCPVCLTGTKPTWCWHCGMEGIREERKP